MHNKNGFSQHQAAEKKFSQITIHRETKKGNIKYKKKLCLSSESIKESFRRFQFHKKKILNHTAAGTHNDTVYSQCNIADSAGNQSQR